jgi:glycosyltransferase involved in cell wall biosynthesis
VRRLLILAPAFPPHPSPATHRARFLTRYAAEHDWQVEVLTVRPELYEEALDRELERLVPPSTKITRVGALPTWLTRRAGVGDLSIRSYFPLRRALRRVAGDSPPDVVFVPGGPFYTFLLAAEIRRSFGVPYVLDFTDPWAFPPMPGQEHPWKKGYWASRISYSLEPIAVRGASHVLSVSDGTNDAIRSRHPDVPGERFSAVPFGFEASDFDSLRERGARSRFWERDGNIHVAYVGAMTPHSYATLRAIFAAVRELRASWPDEGRRLRLHFFGTTYDPAATEGLVTPVAAEEGLADVVTEHFRRIPYLDALTVLTSADALLAFGGTEHHYTASKIFPYILARRPLLAVYHAKSTVCDIVRSTAAGELVTFDDVDRAPGKVGEIAASLRRMLSPGGYDAAAAHTEALDQYSARVMSAKIFDIFDDVVRRDAPGASRTVRAPARVGG